MRRSSSKIESTLAVSAVKYAAGSGSVVPPRASLAISAMRLEDRIARGVGVGLELWSKGTVRLERHGHRLVELGRQELHQDGVAIQPLDLLDRARLALPPRRAPKPRARASDSLSSGPWKTSTSISRFRSMSGSWVRLRDVADAGDERDHVRPIALECRAKLSSSERLGVFLRRSRQTVRRALSSSVHLSADVQPLIDLVERLDVVLDLGSLAGERVFDRLIAVQRGMGQRAVKLQVLQQIQRRTGSTPAREVPAGRSRRPWR